MPAAKKVPFKTIISALLEPNQPFPPTYLHRFSDLPEADLTAMRKAWPLINPERRVSLLEDLVELMEADTVVSFDEVAVLGLADPLPTVRNLSIQLLSESEDDELAKKFLELMKNDPDEEVRAVAATALGKYVFLGDIEEIPVDFYHQILDDLLEVISSTEKTLVRRRALESVSYSMHEDVPDLIQQAYDSGAQEWIASALCAMGRSGNEQFQPTIMSHLDDPNSAVQLEAVRAAGELELASSRKKLMTFLVDESLDEEVRFAAIWSLSQIGGKEVKEVLDALLEAAEDEDESAFIEDAIDNLYLTEMAASFDLLNVTENEELDHIVDLDAEQEDLEVLPVNEDAPKPSRKRHKKN